MTPKRLALLRTAAEKSSEFVTKWGTDEQILFPTFMEMYHRGFPEHSAPELSRVKDEFQRRAADTLSRRGAITSAAEARSRELYEQKHKPAEYRRKQMQVQLDEYEAAGRATTPKLSDTDKDAAWAQFRQDLWETESDYGHESDRAMFLHGWNAAVRRIQES